MPQERDDLELDRSVIVVKLPPTPPDPSKKPRGDLKQPGRG
jgi:hypothetical protein